MLENDDYAGTFAEKRKYPRIPFKIKCKCEHTLIDEELEDGLLHFYSSDLSCGGLFLESQTRLPEGNVIKIEFSLPELEKEIQVKGLVVRADDKGFGIRFLTLGISDFELIDNYVNNRIQ